MCYELTLKNVEGYVLYCRKKAPTEGACTSFWQTFYVNVFGIGTHPLSLQSHVREGAWFQNALVRSYKRPPADEASL